MSISTPVRRPPRLGLLALLLLCACDADPYAPPAVRTPCGSADRPCRFDCSLGCAATVVEVATACQQTLLGTFDATRTTCSFADGSQVQFQQPAPSGGLGPRPWAFTIRRNDADCLTLRATPLPWQVGSAAQELELSLGEQLYHQQLQLSQAAAVASDAGDAATDLTTTTPLPEMVRVRCNGTLYQARGPTACASCAGQSCSALPLVHVTHHFSSETLELQLRVGQRVTPLFACR